MRNRACPEPSPGTGRSAPRPGVASPPSEFCPWVVCLDFSDTLQWKEIDRVLVEDYQKSFPPGER